MLARKASIKSMTLPPLADTGPSAKETSLPSTFLCIAACTRALCSSAYSLGSKRFAASGQTALRFESNVLDD
jgi:hypothetical protein